MYSLGQEVFLIRGTILIRGKGLLAFIQVWMFKYESYTANKIQL